MSFNTSANSSLESFSGKRLSRILKIARSPSAHWYTERSRCSTASSALLVNKVKAKASVGLRWKFIQRQELVANPQFPSFVFFSIFIRTAKVAQTSAQFRSRSRRRGILRGHRQVLCSWARGFSHTSDRSPALLPILIANQEWGFHASYNFSSRGAWEALQCVFTASASHRRSPMKSLTPLSLDGYVQRLAMTNGKMIQEEQDKCCGISNYIYIYIYLFKTVDI